MRPTDDAGDLIAYEQGELTDEQTVELFQRLTDSGLVWNLQGSYGRTAVRLIEAGLVSAPRVAQTRAELGLPATTFRPRQGPIAGFRSHHVRGGHQ